MKNNRINRIGKVRALVTNTKRLSIHSFDPGNNKFKYRQNRYVLMSRMNDLDFECTLTNKLLQLVCLVPYFPGC